MKTLIPFAALAAVLPLVPATAETPARMQVVRFSHLEIASPTGRAKLDRRIHRAAATVCGTASDFDLAGQNEARRCRTAAVASANRALAQTIAARRSTLTVAANDR